MYESHFGLRERPFRAAPDSSCYYPATGHEQALARLLQVVRDDEGLAVLTGGPGVGKTLLCHILLERLGPAFNTAYLTHTHFADRAALLQAILYDLSLPFEGRSEQELRLTLTDHLLKEFGAGRRTVLLVDEAQNLTPDQLEELRLLGNLEGRHGKAWQVVLVGQPTLLDLLGRPELAVYAQRVAAWVRLEPLGLHEAADYMVYQVRVVGGKPDRLLTDEALEILARCASGVPRLINRLAHHALQIAHIAGADQVDAEVALEIASAGESREAEASIAPTGSPEETASTNEEACVLPSNLTVAPARRPA